MTAKGTIAQHKAELTKVNNPNYMRLKELEYQAEIAKAFIGMPTPSVVFNGEGSTQTANTMFLGDGASLVNIALKQKSNLFGSG